MQWILPQIKSGHPAANLNVNYQQLQADQRVMHIAGWTNWEHTSMYDNLFQWDIYLIHCVNVVFWLISFYVIELWHVLNTPFDFSSFFFSLFSIRHLRLLPLPWTQVCIEPWNRILRDATLRSYNPYCHLIVGVILDQHWCSGCAGGDWTTHCPYYDHAKYRGKLLITKSVLCQIHRHLVFDVFDICLCWSTRVCSC